MAEYGAIPAELDGVPIPALSDVQVSMSRVVNQNITTDGARQTHGIPLFIGSITFKTLTDRASFLRQLGAYSRIPTPRNLTYTLGADRFTLTSVIASGTAVQSDQNGTASLTIQVSAEDHIDEGA